MKYGYFDDKAKEPFEKNPEMTAKLEDFALFVANWEHKGQNIANMQKRLNIGFDSMIFIDDSAFERGSVRDMLPDVKVPEMPPEPSDYVDFLRGQHLFETVAWSEEDAKRNDMYRAEADRAILSESFADYGDYLYFPYQFDCWQYSLKGTVTGIEGDVSLDLRVKTDAEE
jgi:FkbH-like protein